MPFNKNNQMDIYIFIVVRDEILDHNDNPFHIHHLHIEYNTI